MSILISGTGSGSGKTSVSMALAAALVERGQVVSPFKAGPDFLDPMHLSAICGTPCYNLDTWMSSKGHVRELTESSSGLPLIEGVMGYFDGGGKSGTRGSAAELASVLGSAVILVAPCSGMSESFAALVSGFCNFSPAGERIKGVVANGCNSLRHRQILADCLEKAALPPLVGAIPSCALPALKSRHLGLVPDTEQESAEFFPDFARAGEKYLDVDRIASLSDSSGKKRQEPRAVQKPRGPRIAVARDAAFNFYYPANLDILAECGAQIEFFSPLNDKKLPRDIHALFLGGGYPEIFASDLAGNTGIKREIAAFAGNGGNVYAECGGMIYLGEVLQDLPGETHGMCEVLPLQFSMHSRRKSLGYIQVELARECILGEEGTTLRGHEFHYSSVKSCKKSLPDIYRATNSRGEEVQAQGFFYKNVLASYVHIYFGHSRETARRITSYITGKR